MPIYEIRGQRHVLANDNEAILIECNMAVYEGNCSGNNPVMVAVLKEQYQANTLFGEGEWYDELSDAKKEANQAYHVASTSCNTSYTPDVEVKTRMTEIK